MVAKPVGLDRTVFEVADITVRTETRCLLERLEPFRNADRENAAAMIKRGGAALSYSRIRPKILGLISAISLTGGGCTMAIAQSSPPATSCQIQISSCPNLPTFSGTISDNYANSASNQSVCVVQRPQQIYSYCGIGAGTVTASFISNGTVVQSATVGTSNTTTSAASPVTSCQVQISSCPNLPSFSGTVSDNYNNSASNQSVCLSERPQQIYSYCGIPAGGGTVMASFISNGTVVQSATVGTPNTTASTALPVTSCQVQISSCPNLPSFSGTVADNYNNSASNQSVCLSERPQQIYSYCGIPAGVGTVMASFISNGAVVQSATVGTQNTNTSTALPITSCQVQISSCPNLPSFSGTVSDNYNNSASNQSVCLSERPQQIYSYCGIPAGGGTVMASFISNGTVVQSATVGSPTTATATPPTAPTTTGTVKLNPNACVDFTLPLPKLSLPSNALGDEFVGPFASWADLKRDYGAKGDGLTDDTNAIQLALNALSTAAGKAPVLFIPAGTYLIKRTLTVKSAESISILGEDPNITILKWAGTNYVYPSTAALLHIDGVSYSRFNRLTFDGNGSGVVLVDQSVQDYTQGRQFDTGNEYADDVFKNGLIGIQGGQYGLGAAETSILRAKFYNNAWGILLKNFNTLDWWIWNSYFERNGSSISNIPGAGNFHAYGNVFNGSAFADLALLNTGTFNFRDNYSLNSKKFLYEQFYYTNAAVTRLQGNTVITPSGNDCGGCSVDQGNMGPLIMTDNTFVSPPDATSSAVLVRSQNPPDCVSVGDTFTNSKTIQCGNNGAGRLISIDGKVVSASTINQSAPSLPGVLPNYNRRVIDIPANATSVAIQQAIQQATASCGNRPVVHLQRGTYYINQTITVPANCDIQIVGDGKQSMLTWAGSGNGPVLQLLGPSRAILRDFYINASNVTGIEVQNADQEGSRVYMQQMSALRSLTSNIFVDSLDYTQVELDNFQLAYTAAAPASSGIGLKVIGGPLAQQGNPQYGRTKLLAGSSATNFLSYQASQGASLLVRDAWYESNSASNFAQVSENSSVTFEGLRISNSGGSGGVAAPTNLDAVQLNNLSCNATFLSSAPDSDVKINGGRSGNAWILGNNFGSASNYFTNLAPGVSSAFNLNRYTTNADGSLPILDKTAMPDPGFTRTMLAQSRSAHPASIYDLPSGVTDVRLYRVWVELGNIGVHIRR